MAFELPQLPYSMDALKPHLSAETLEYHHGKHHAAYVNNLNNLIKGSPNESKSLEDIVKSAPSGGLFNNAAQHFNHSFYWKSLAPKAGGAPKGAIADAIKSGFGSFDEFKKKFTEAATTHFGSGWAWLVRKPDGSLAIEATHDAGTPLTGASKPILTCDVWEHAYYIDYRNARPRYIEAFWNLANWEFASDNLA
ncbi:MAG TPA: Fe-Mn family superoxide dismutase [Blastocatellia bacterium]|nr:Fe-Mn family superoxide dismutase [Blastocatellia bacterium]